MSVARGQRFAFCVCVRGWGLGSGLGLGLRLPRRLLWPVVLQRVARREGSETEKSTSTARLFETRSLRHTWIKGSNAREIRPPFQGIRRPPRSRLFWDLYLFPPTSSVCSSRVTRGLGGLGAGDLVRPPFSKTGRPL